MIEFLVFWGQFGLSILMMLTGIAFFAAGLAFGVLFVNDRKMIIYIVMASPPIQGLRGYLLRSVTALMNVALAGAAMGQGSGIFNRGLDMMDNLHIVAGW